MPVTKISISLSRDALEVIDSSASHQGITRSAWIEQAAVEAGRRAALAEVLLEYQRETGRPITSAEIQAARRRIYDDRSATK